MKGDARATKEASPTPTSMRHRMRLQKPQARPQPAVASVQMPRPTAMRRKALWCLLASAKMGEDTSRPTCKRRMRCSLRVRICSLLSGPAATARCQQQGPAKASEIQPCKGPETEA